MSEDRSIEQSCSESVPAPLESDLSARADTVRDAQRALAAEAVLSATEMVERIRIEIDLWNEFMSKIAVAHSVRDIGTMWDECGRHQIEWARRQSGLLFDHGLRALDVTASLLKGSKIHERDTIQ